MWARSLWRVSDNKRFSNFQTSVPHKSGVKIRNPLFSKRGWFERMSGGGDWGTTAILIPCQGWMATKMGSHSRRPQPVVWSIATNRFRTIGQTYPKIVSLICLFSPKIHNGLPYSNRISPWLTEIGPLPWQAKQTTSALCQLQPVSVNPGQILLFYGTYLY